MSGGDLIKWGVIGLAGWWVYETFFATPAAATSTATSSTPATTATTTTAPTTTPAATVNTSGFANLAALYTALVAKAQAGMTAGDAAVTSSNGTLSATGYVWNYYLAAAAPSVKTANIPASALTGSQTYTSDQYWGAVSATIGTQLGLSGLQAGLAGLSAVLMRRGRR